MSVAAAASGAAERAEADSAGSGGRHVEARAPASACEAVQDPTSAAPASVYLLQIPEVQ